MLEQYEIDRRNISFHLDKSVVNTWKRFFTSTNEKKIAKKIINEEINIEYKKRNHDNQCDIISLTKDSDFTLSEILVIIQYMSKIKILSEDKFNNILQDSLSPLKAGNSLISYQKKIPIMAILVVENKIKFFPKYYPDELSKTLETFPDYNNSSFKNSFTKEYFWLEFNTTYYPLSLHSSISSILEHFSNLNFINNEDTQLLFENIMKSLLSNYSKETIKMLERFSKSPNMDHRCSYKDIANEAIDAFHKIDENIDNDKISLTEILNKAHTYKTSFASAPPIIKRGFNKLDKFDL